MWLFVVIGAIELITMLIAVIFVPDRPAPPTTLTLKQRAFSAWGTDLLAQRDYIWLLVSRLFVLTALVSLPAFAVFFLENAHGMAPDEAQTAQFPLILTVAVAAPAQCPFPGAGSRRGSGASRCLFAIGWASPGRR